MTRCSCGGRCSSCSLGALGPGDPVGRWGPVRAPGGRTIGEPCTGLLDSCTDWDVDAWQAEANLWLKHCRRMRAENLPVSFPDPATWPTSVKYGEAAFRAAENLNAGAQGWTDGAKVATLQEVQRLAKTAAELWTLAIEGEFGIPDVLVPPDVLLDPSERKPVTPLPSLPDLGGGLIKIGLAAGLLALLGRSR